MAKDPTEPSVHGTKADPAHLAVLKRGAEAWNKWRQENPEVVPNLEGLNLHKNNLGHDDLRLCNLADARLRGVKLERAYLSEANLQRASLSEANLQGANLSEANLEGASLSEANLQGTNLSEANLEGANLSEANLQGADLSKANLQKAQLERAHLEGANLVDAHLEGAELVNAHLEGVVLACAHLESAKLWDAHLEGAELEYAQLEGAELEYAHLEGAILAYANLERANLRGASVEGADLRATRGLRLDSTIVRNARFSARASDPWSVLRRGYTGPKLFFNVLFLAAFLVPYVAKTCGWVGVNRVQTEAEALVEDLRAEAEKPAETGDTALEETAEEKTKKWFITAAEKRLPSRNPEGWSESRVWRLVIGVDKGALYWLTAILLIVYNGCRALLTWFVAPMRDEEERSGHSPRYRRDPARRVARIRRPRAAVLWFDSWFEAYGWLIWPHRVTQALFWFAIGSFLFHAVHWLSLPVWIPAN